MRQSARAIVVHEGRLLVMKRDKAGHEFYSLVGGGIDPGETAIDALHREVREEATIEVRDPRLVIVEDAGERFGRQFIYLCEYVSGEPRLAPDSIEARFTAEGNNRYEPLWLPLDELRGVNLLPTELKAALIDGLDKGFPEKPLQLIIRQ